MFNLITFFITIFGGINWFCIGLFQFDLIAGIFGSQATFISRFFYCIIGISAIYLIIAAPIKKWRIYISKNEVTKIKEKEIVKQNTKKPKKEEKKQTKSPVKKNKIKKDKEEPTKKTSEKSVTLSFGNTKVEK